MLARVHQPADTVDLTVVKDEAVWDRAWAALAAAQDEHIRFIEEYQRLYLI